MSNFVINKTGLDQVTLEFMQTGNSETSVNLKEALLDESKNYVFCVDHLSIPLDSVPINNTIDQELFRIQRRNVGQSLDEEGPNFQINTTGIDGNGTEFIYNLDDKYYDVPSFVRTLNNFSRGFEQRMSETGLLDLRLLGGDSNAANADDAEVAPLRILPALNVVPPRYDFIRFKLAVDGTLVIVMTHDFTNNFILKFTRYGAEVLGLGNKISAVVRHPVTYIPPPGPYVGPAQTDYYLVVTNANNVNFFTPESWVEDALVFGILQTNTIKAGENIRSIEVRGEHSLYTCLDQRVRISVTSHLPILNSMLVREGVQTVDRNIAEVFFNNLVSVSAKFDDEGTFKEQSIRSTLYAGQFPFIKKSDPYKQWHKLLTSYNLRFFRFHVYMTYRIYDSLKDEWVMKTDRLKIDDTKYWEFSLRFISEV